MSDEKGVVTVQTEGGKVVISKDADKPAPEPAVEPAAPAPINEDRSTWGRFFGRLATVLVRPHGFWKRLQTRRPHPTLGELLWPHLTLLALVGAGTVLLGHIFGGMDVGHAIIRGAVQFVSAFLLVLVVAVVARLVVIRGKDPSGPRGKTFLRAFALAAYGCVPLLLAPVIAVIPSQFATTVAGVVLMPWAFWTLSGGLHDWLGIKEKRGASAASILCATVFISWALLEFLRQLAVNAAVIVVTAPTPPLP